MLDSDGDENGAVQELSTLADLFVVDVKIFDLEKNRGTPTSVRVSIRFSNTPRTTIIHSTFLLSSRPAAEDLHRILPSRISTIITKRYSS